MEQKDILEEAVKSLCDIVLATYDTVDLNEICKYVNYIEQEDISLLLEQCTEKRIKDLVKPNIRTYILRDTWKRESSGPFSFAKSVIDSFQQEFNKQYTSRFGKSAPRNFSIIFDMIKESYNFYEFFNQLYHRQSNLMLDFELNNFRIDYNKLEDTAKNKLDEISVQAKDSVKKAAEEAAKEAAKEAEEAAKEAVKEAEKAAKAAAEEAAASATCKARKLANKAENDARRAANDAQMAVEKSVAKLNADLSRKTAETSVTVLGIFAAIVITIVAGLFFTSSVMQSINEANVFRLVLASSVVGLVCFNMVIGMIRYIGKFSGAGSKKNAVRIINKSMCNGSATPSKDLPVSQDATIREHMDKAVNFDKTKTTPIDAITVFVNTVLVLLIIVSLYGTCKYDFSGKSSTVDDSISVNASADGRENHPAQNSVDVSSGIDISGDISVTDDEQESPSLSNPNTGGSYS